MKGVLRFKNLSAKLTHDTEFFGKMDPYLAFTINNI